MNTAPRPGRRLLNAGGLLGLACVTVMAYHFFAQESMIFHPSPLDANYVFTASGPVEEHFITMSDGVRLNAVLVRAPNSRGVVYYLHGNAGSLAGWINMDRDFTSQGYDFFAIDYRGYGKSEGIITSEAQFYDDGERGYAWLGGRYPEHQTIVVGFSIGAGVAAHVACGHSPRRLVLKAPFYSMTDLAKRVVPFVPGFLLKYPFRVHESVKNCRAPIHDHPRRSGHDHSDRHVPPAERALQAGGSAGGRRRSRPQRFDGHGGLPGSHPGRVEP